MENEDKMQMCKALARRFLHQARHLGDKETAFQELFNEAYVAVEEGKQAVWALLWYVEVRERERRRGKDDRIRYKVEVPSADEIAERKEESERLVKAVAKLEPRERFVVERYYGDGKNFVEIGRMLGTKADSPRRLLGSTVEKLRRMLG